jgi:hypothetical protein
VVWVGLWAGVVRSSPGRRLTLSENPGKVLGESRARRKILGVICREFRENVGILHHRTASFAGAPITDDKRCHVTQPRAKINVSCSRAGPKERQGVAGTSRQEAGKDHKKGGSQTRVLRSLRGRARPLQLPGPGPYSPCRLTTLSPDLFAGRFN